MRKKYLFLAAALVFVIAAATASAVDRNTDPVTTARADVTVMAEPGVAVRPPGTVARSVQDFRNSAALVLVGTMLLGLAAAVRRTV
ncbi:MAG: hypothetical protein ACM3NQ_12300 [Bacteroidales bacterium]